MRNGAPRLLAGFLAVATLLAASIAQAAGMGAQEARHLLARSGFAPSAAEIRDFAGLTRAQGVERLLAGAASTPRTPPPAWVDEPLEPRALRQASVEVRREMLQKEFQKGVDLRSWWIGEMISTPSPLTERMTLFWHGHFTSSQQKVRFSQLMYRQNVLLRRYALGNFGELLHAVSRDPAMVVYLDSATNRRDHPNENFAREVMELFTLGEGHYTEADVREAARAFTGWSIEPATGEFLWRPRQHDEGDKTVLGRTGNFNGDDVLDLLLAQPATAVNVVNKLWRELVSPTPDPVEVQRIAAVFRDSRYDVRSTLRALFLSPAFWAEENRGSLVKSPAELVVGTVRSFNVQVGDPIPLAFLLNGLGQNLFGPPNVKGWPGGDAWINSSTLLARKQFVERLFRADDRLMTERPRDALPAAKGLARLAPEARERMARAVTEFRFDAPAWSKQFADGAPLSAQSATLALAPVTPPPARATPRELARSLALDPVYQLK